MERRDPAARIAEERERDRVDQEVARDEHALGRQANEEGVVMGGDERPDHLDRSLDDLGDIAAR